MRRQQGEVRQKLAEAVATLHEQRGACTWRDAAELAQVGYRLARITVVNMERAGQVEPVGQEKRAHSRRWMKLYAPRQPGDGGGNFATATTGADGLAGALRAWHR